MECKCAKCGEVREIACLVDGLPWCEGCFGEALGKAAQEGGGTNGASD